MKYTLLLTALFLCFGCKAQSLPQSVIYKSVVSAKGTDMRNLPMDVIYPDYMEPAKKYPCIVFFFGGGWVSGSRSQFKYFAEYFSKRGIICFLPDYRTKKSDGTSPFEAVKDAKTAIRYIRKNAAVFQVNPDSIVAAGGSAGGHLAASTALIDDFNDETGDEFNVSCKPQALILFNPVVDNGPYAGGPSDTTGWNYNSNVADKRETEMDERKAGGYGYDRIKGDYKRFSPIYNITKGAPPTLILTGTSDDLVPVSTIKEYQSRMRAVNSKCDVILYPGAEHAFFNRTAFRPQTALAADSFLTALHYLNPIYRISKPGKIFFTEYFEGNRDQRALEISNFTNAPVPLNRLRLKFFPDGRLKCTDSVLLKFADDGSTKNLPAKGVFVIYCKAADRKACIDPDVNLKGLAAQYRLGLSDSVLKFDGNDAIALECDVDGCNNWQVVDFFGRKGEKPDRGWITGSIQTFDRSLERKPFIATGQNESAVFNPALQWQANYHNKLPDSKIEFKTLGEHNVPNDI